MAAKRSELVLIALNEYPEMGAISLISSSLCSDSMPKIAPWIGENPINAMTSL